MVNVTLLSADGSAAQIDIPIGTSVMEGAVRAGIPGIDADCGGALSCATCHVYVRPEWRDRIPPATAAELDLLEMAIDRESDSRLSCQIVIDSALEGLTVAIPERQR